MIKGTTAYAAEISGCRGCAWNLTSNELQGFTDKQEWYAHALPLDRARMSMCLSEDTCHDGNIIYLKLERVNEET